MTTLYFEIVNYPCLSTQAKLYFQMVTPYTDFFKEHLCYNILENTVFEYIYNLV